MKTSRLFIGLGLVVAISAVIIAKSAYSQGVFSQTATTQKRAKIPDPMTILASRVDDLEKEQATLKAALKKAQDDVKAYKAECDQRNMPPHGYTTMFITRANFDHVEGTALMKFFVRY